MASAYPQDALVTQAEELRRIVQHSTLPAFIVWIHEDLHDEVRQLWEEQRDWLADVIERRTP